MAVDQTIAQGPQLAPIPIPQNTGAPIAEGLDALGEGAHALQEHKDAALAASQGATLATMGDQMQVDLANLQKTAGDAPDYVDQARAVIGDYSNRFQAGFGTNWRVRQQFEEASAKTFGHAEAQQQLWSIDNQAKIQGDQAQATADTGVNQIMGDPSDQRVDAVVAVNNATIAGLHLPDGEKLQRQYEGQARTAQVEGLLNAGNYAAASAKLDSGALDPFISPEEKEALSRKIIVSQKQAGEQQLKLLDMQRADLASRAPAAAEVAALANQYAALPGDRGQTQAIELRSQAEQIAASDAHRGDAPAERQAAIDQLLAMPQRSQQQEQTLKGLQAQAALVNGMSTLQRYGYATQAPVAPLDWTDPNSIRQRAAVVAAAQDRFGGTADFLLPGEEKPIQQLIASPKRDDRVAAAQAILQAGPYSGAVLDQVAPKDHDFRSAIALAALPQGDHLMDLALRGPQALKDAPAMLTPDKDPVTNKPGPNFDAILNSTDIGRATALLPPEYRTALYDNTHNLYGGFGDQGGWTSLHPQGVRVALHSALGGAQQRGQWVGGLGDWQGQAVVLPRGMAQAEFDQRLARAGGADWINASTNPADPPWTGNRALHGDQLRSLVPVMVRDGVYALRQGNSYITTKSGAQFTFDVRKLSGRPTAAPTTPTAATDPGGVDLNPALPGKL